MNYLSLLGLVCFFVIFCYAVISLITKYKSLTSEHKRDKVHLAISTLTIVGIDLMVIIQGYTH